MTRPPKIESDLIRVPPMGIQSPPNHVAGNVARNVDVEAVPATGPIDAETAQRHRVPGGHFNLFQEPHLLAHRLRCSIDHASEG